MSLLSRRQALTAAGASVTAAALAPFAARAEEKAATPKHYVLPKLPYSVDALEPHIDAKTMEIHHDKHHQAYINNALTILKGHAELLAMPVNDLLTHIKRVPDKLRQGAINNVGGHSNHTIFWEVMGPKGGGEPSGALAKDIDSTFGSFDKFQKLFSLAATTQFGSGWAWLVADDKGKLKVVQRKNQDSPIMDGLKPLLGIDVWEHAYYLKYQNRRPDYIAAWWKTVNWKAVSDRMGS
ncbi:MAG: superoxide dismutase [Gemmataceae bacterium]